MRNIYYEIQENVKKAQFEMEECCINNGRSVTDVMLMAVSKTQTTDKLQAAAMSGIQLFGENRVQELMQKSVFFQSQEVNCHLIGQLQTNKAKYLPTITDVIQGVDNIRVAAEISKQYGKHNQIANILLEVNIGEESSKYGISVGEVEELAWQISELDNVRLKGLMCIPPKCSSQQVRKYFGQMYRLFSDIDCKKIPNVTMSTLSMGMSGDYKEAIAEGSTLVRIGRGIFGERDYK